MAGNAGERGGSLNSGRVPGPSVSAPRAPDAPVPVAERRSRWRGCFSGFSCFGSQKRVKRIVPSSRIPEGNGSVSHGNGPQAGGLSNQNTTLTPSLLAPPSSPASFTNSGIPSTAHSPSFLSISANSPRGSSSNMFATGPYAHETQLVSPPVFSTFTTEPSTAPLTPPPELAHLTTPSSPEVPYARFLSSSLDIKTSRKVNGGSYLSTGYASGSDLQATYPLYPGSPSSSFISPASGTPRTGLSSPFPEAEIATQWGAPLSACDSPYSRSQSSKLFGHGHSSSKNFMLSPDSSFFYPARAAQFHLDQAQQSFSSYPHCGGRLSVSRDADAHGSAGGHRHGKGGKQDVEEIEAYRASFGFSADELITAQNYVDISDPADDSFTMSPFASNDKRCTEPCPITETKNVGERTGTVDPDLPTCRSPRSPYDHASRITDETLQESCDALKGCKLRGLRADACVSDGHRHAATAEEELFSKTRDSRASRSFRAGSSLSDAEVDYRRSKSLRGNHGVATWHS